MANRRKIAATALLVSALGATAARAELKLPSVFTDHAVLQADTPLPIWGWADAGDTITVTLGDTKATATADDHGKWTATLPRHPANQKPTELTVMSGKGESLKRTDILIGEVWLGSGQSNMALKVSQSANGKEAIAAADQPTIRLFQVPRKTADAPVDDTTGKWVVCSPDTVKGFSAALYFFGRELNQKLSVPVGLIHSSWGGTPIQAWMPAAAFKSPDDIAEQDRRVLAHYPPPTQPTKTKRNLNHLRPTMLYNGMIAPLIPYAIRGMTWYQGENNVHQNDIDAYLGNLQRMAETWRAKWAEGDFPLLIVQIAPFGKYEAPPDTLPRMWEQQTRALTTISATGLAPTGDIGNLTNIHPTNKQEVGRRLTLIALATTYHQAGVEYLPPMYKSHAIEGNKIRVQFTGAAGGLVARDEKAASNFEIAGADGVFVPAEMKIDGESVVIWSDKIDKPIAVRFAWSSTAIPNLENHAGLPAIAFRTNAPEAEAQKN